jgi:hypothetical protein
MVDKPLKLIYIELSFGELFFFIGEKLNVFRIEWRYLKKRAKGSC